MKLYYIRKNTSIYINDKLYREIKKIKLKEERSAEKIATFETSIDKDVSEIAYAQDKEIVAYVEDKEVIQNVMEIINNEIDAFERYIVTEIIINGRSRKEIAQESGNTYKQIVYKLNSTLAKIRKIYIKNYL